jgi:RNA-directed DNA polymerase
MSSDVRHSFNWLARTISINIETLKLLGLTARPYFRRREIPKKNGEMRVLDVPRGLLKHVQPQISELILKPKPSRECVQGCVRGHSPHSNAKWHLHPVLLVTIDIKDFFPSVTNRAVYKTWCESFLCVPDVARLLTLLTTYKGQLPQGAPTSPGLANWALAPFDDVLEGSTKAANVAYTRYADDICFSGERATEFIQLAINQLGRLGYAVSRKKVKVMTPRSSQVVTGYTVARATGPSVSRGKREKLLNDIRLFRQMGGDPTKPSPELASLNGRIAYVRRTNPGTAKRFERALIAGKAQPN